MQERLTLWQAYLKATRKSTERKRVVRRRVACVVGAILFLIILFVAVTKNDKWIKNDKYYFVVVGDNLSLSSALAYKKQVEEAGGAGELMSTTNDGQYTVIIFAYKSKNDAEKVQKSSKEIFEHCYLICKEVEEISQKTQTKIKNMSGIFESIELVNNAYESATNNMFSFEKGELEYNKLYRFAISLSDELQRAKSNLTENDEFSAFMRASLLSINAYLEAFIEEGISGNVSLLNLRKFCVNTLIQNFEINRKLSQLE